MRRVIALLPFVLVIATGCGDDDDDSTETVTVSTTETAVPLTKAEYIEQADAICRGYDEQIEPFEEEAETNLDNGDFAAAAAVLGEAVEVGRTGLEELEALPKPPGDEAVLNQLEDLRQEQVALVARGADAIREEDLDRINSIDREINSVNERSDGIATGYGFKVCGQD